MLDFRSVGSHTSLENKDNGFTLPTHSRHRKERMCGRGWRLLPRSQLRYPYPPPVLLPAKCFYYSRSISAKVCHQTHSIINRHLLPTSPLKTDRTGLRVTTAIFALPFCFGRYPVLIRYSLKITGIPPHPLTAIPASSGG